MSDKLKVLFLDDNKHRHRRFFEMNSDLSRRHVHNAGDCLTALRDRDTKYDIIFLDHDLDERTNNILIDSEKDGRFVAKNMAESDIRDTYKGTTVVIHSLSTLGAKAMNDILKDAGYTKVFIHPFVWESHVGSLTNNWV